MKTSPAITKTAPITVTRVCIFSLLVTKSVARLLSRPA
jgi:hypothetical protein